MEKVMLLHSEQEWQIMECCESSLEQKLIGRYLAEKGYSLLDLEKLPLEQVKPLMAEACQQAALKLTEIESTAKLWAELEG